MRFSRSETVYDVIDRLGEGLAPNDPRAIMGFVQSIKTEKVGRMGIPRAVLELDRPYESLPEHVREHIRDIHDSGGVNAYREFKGSTMTITPYNLNQGWDANSIDSFMQMIGGPKPTWS